MKLAAVCCTYLRAHLLPQLVDCFLTQDYPADRRELVILDDAGEYQNQQGDGWRLISVPDRYATLGEKRNAAMALASPDVDGFCVWDDDDLYLPWALSASATALQQAPLSRPSQVLYLTDETFAPGTRFYRRETGGLYHGGWAFRREAIERIGGYRPINSGEDQELLGRLIASGFATADPLEHFDPFYCYRDHTNSYHLSWLGLGEEPYRHLGESKHNGVKTALPIGWPVDLSAIPIMPTVLPRPF